MSRKFYTILMAVALFASVLGFSVSGATAASAAGTGPDDALSPSGQWTTLAVGQQAWYAFRYEGDGSQILVRMSNDSSNPASFEVWTPDQLQQWARGDRVTPVGRGSANDFFGGDLVWTGSFYTPGTYYVIVNQSGSSAANYSLQISGAAVSFSKPAASDNATPAAASAETAKPAAASAETTKSAAASAETTKSAAASTETAKPAAAAKSGTGPGDALTATGQWAPLAPGQQVWYAFSYSGDGAPIQVQLSAAPNNAASFAVWTSEQLARSAQDDTVQPVGRGSVNDALGGDLAWAGSFNAPGTYYVVVTSAGLTPASYLLAIN